MLFDIIECRKPNKYNIIIQGHICNNGITKYDIIVQYFT